MTYDCRACGACCVAERDEPTYVMLVDGDLERLTPRSRKLHVLSTKLFPCDDGTDLLKTKHDASGNCVCIALRGAIGKRVSCGIYDRRPHLCQRFAPGGESCKYARQIAGIDGPYPGTRIPF